MRKWKIKAEGGKFRLLSPACRNGSIITHGLAFMVEQDHPIKCRHLFDSIPAAHRAIQQEESWQAFKARQREMSAKLMERSFAREEPGTPRPAALLTLQEPPC